MCNPKNQIQTLHLYKGDRWEQTLASSEDRKIGGAWQSSWKLRGKAAPGAASPRSWEDWELLSVQRQEAGLYMILYLCQRG